MVWKPLFLLSRKVLPGTFGPPPFNSILLCSCCKFLSFPVLQQFYFHNCECFFLFLKNTLCKRLKSCWVPRNHREESQDNPALESQSRVNLWRKHLCSSVNLAVRGGANRLHAEQDNKPSCAFRGENTKAAVGKVLFFENPEDRSKHQIDHVVFRKMFWHKGTVPC